jgi:hypothetical protein
MFRSIQAYLLKQLPFLVTPNNERSNPDQDPIQLSLDLDIGTVQYLISLWASLKPAISTRICQSFLGTASGWTLLAK